MIEWYKKVVFQNYANFNGRARRSEYWYFLLFNIAIFFLVAIIGAILGSLFNDVMTGLVIAYVFILLYNLATLIPSIAVLVRRLHDVNKSGWFYFVAFIPLVGVIWLIILLCSEGTSGNNEYGSDPKNEVEGIDEIGIQEA